MKKLIELSDLKFQFYDSPIKRIFRRIITTTNHRFNSMIVRLKGSGVFIFFESSLFQFYDSPIKSRSKRQKTLLILNNLSFNYINKLTNKVVEAQR